jgi:hypothetical protein
MITSIDLKSVLNTAINKAMSYADYRKMGEKLHAANKTTGPDQSETMVNYSKMNEHRMKRLDKTIVLSAEIIEVVQAIKSPQTWLVITELWCGDAAQNVPLMNKIAELNPLIQLKLVLRDENPELMNLFLTNGGKSIPILIALNEQLEVLWLWGPRPVLAQNMLMEYKNAPEPKMLYAEFGETLHKWYALNKTQMAQSEISHLISDSGNAQ